MSDISTAEAIELIRHAREMAGHSPNTARLDGWIMRAIGKPPGQATLADLEAVVLRNADRGTRATYASRLRSCFEILNRLGAIDNDAHLGLPNLSHPKRKPRPFSDDQVARLMAEMTDPHRSVVRFALLTGARAMEVYAFEGQHLLQGANGYEILLHGKGGTKMTVPAHPDVVQIINSANTLGRIFHFSSPAALSHIMSHAIRDVLGDGHTFHQCRHTFGTRVYRSSGNSLVLTQQLMRHASIGSTLGYAAIAEDAPRAAVALLTA